MGRLGTATSSYSYGYDAVGNLTNNNGITQTYDAANQLTAAGPITYTFDANGNQAKTSRLTAPTWGYDAQNHTTSYSDTYALDTFLTTSKIQRETKAMTSTLFGTTRGTYDDEMMGLGLYQQTAPTTRTMYYERDPNGRLLVVTDGTTVYYYGLDGHGSVVNLTDRNGVVQDSYRYDPYGNMLSAAENATLSNPWPAADTTLFNPWRYAGGYWDAESGLYLLGARYYAPRLGRFLQQDPLGGISQCSYAGSDPCNNSDPSGEAPIKPCVGRLYTSDNITVSFGAPTYGRGAEPGRLFWHVKVSANMGLFAQAYMAAASVNGRAINPPYGAHDRFLPYDFHSSMLTYNYMGEPGGGTLHAGDVVQFTWYVL